MLGIDEDTDLEISIKGENIVIRALRDSSSKVVFAKKSDKSAGNNTSVYARKISKNSIRWDSEKNPPINLSYDENQAPKRDIGKVSKIANRILDKYKLLFEKLAKL